MVQGIETDTQASKPGFFRNWLIKRGFGSFEPPSTAMLDSVGLRLARPVLESIVITPLSIDKPTEDFAISNPSIWLWDYDRNPISDDITTTDIFIPLSKSKVDGTIFLRESSQEKQLELNLTPGKLDGKRQQKIIAPSQKRSTPQSPQALNIFELLLPILLPPEGTAHLEGLVLPNPLYDFQNAGVAFLGKNDSALLGDDMGLGKTVQAIVALRLLVRTGRIRGALIICNKAIMPQWKKHLNNWAPDIVYYPVDGMRDRRKVFWDTLTGINGMKCHGLLATYETIRQDSDILNGRFFDLVILDEVQRIKNQGIGITRAINGLGAKRRWGLSGTPLENRIEDLHSIYSFLKPGLLKENDLSPGIVSKKISPYFLRRRKEDVLKDLPPKSIQDQWLALTPKQRYCYDRAEREGVIKLKSGENITVQHVLALITRLKQICNFEPESGESTKAEYVLLHLDEICDGGHKAILFSQYVATLQQLSEKMKKYVPLLYTGGLGDKQRETVIDTFKSDDSRQILLLSLKAGGTGLDLPEANFVFHYDLWWNPSVQRQAEDRVHRIGQTKPVFVRRLLAEDTIEARIDEILRQKALLFNQTIEGLSDTDLTQSLTEDELFGLFGLKAPRVVAAEEARLSWQKVDGIGFERLIAKLYEAMGFTTRVTKRSHDGGIDIEGWHQQTTGAERILIQCKHWPDRQVGESIIRDLYGVLSSRQDVDRAELVTSGTISREARQWAQSKRIRLVNGIELRSLLTKYSIIY